MKKQLKVISLLGFSVLFLSACGKNTAGNKVAAAPMKAQANKPETIDLQKLSPQEKAQVEKQALDVKNLLKLSGEADNVFREITKRGLGFEMADNIFKGLLTALKSGYSEGGLPLEKSANANEQCQRSSLTIIKHTEITQNSIKFQAPEAYSLERGACAAALGQNKIEAMKDSSGRHFFRYSHLPLDGSTWVGNILNMHGFPSEKKQEGTDKSQQPIFEFIKTGIVARCDMYMNEDGKLTYLNCVNVGHDISKTSAIVFKRLFWESASKTSTFTASALQVELKDSERHVTMGLDLVDDVKEGVINVKVTEFETGKTTDASVPRDDAKPGLPSDKEMKAPLASGETAPAATSSGSAKEVKPLSEVNTNEPVMQSGDQAISPDQVGVDGEIVPLEQIDTATQGIPSVR